VLSNVSDAQIDEIWNSMTDDEKAVYGGEDGGKDALKKDITESVNFATSNFAKAGDAAMSHMTSGMAVAFKNKLDDVSGKQNGAENREVVK
jgi:hypothetical protein